MDTMNELVKWLYELAIKSTGYLYTDDFLLWYDKKLDQVCIKRRSADMIDRG